MTNQNQQGNPNSADNSTCTCPSCGHQIDHERGVPCSKGSCPKCQTPMQGDNCQEE